MYPIYNRLNLSLFLAWFWFCKCLKVMQFHTFSYNMMTSHHIEEWRSGIYLKIRWDWSEEKSLHISFIYDFPLFFIMSSYLKFFQILFFCWIWENILWTAKHEKSQMNFSSFIACDQEWWNEEGNEGKSSSQEISSSSCLQQKKWKNEQKRWRTKWRWFRRKKELNYLGFLSVSWTVSRKKEWREWKEIL